jgi:Sec-independent protein translocase protein TatA
MHSFTLSELVPVLQIAIGPVILISGVGLLLLTMTNRLGRAVDRIRALTQELRKAPEGEKPNLREQIGMIHRRAKLIRLSIILAGISVLLASTLIVTLFLMALFRLELAPLIVGLFTVSILSLVASVGAFVLDINWALLALKIEIERP